MKARVSYNFVLKGHFLYQNFEMYVEVTYPVFCLLVIEHMEDTVGLLFRYITLLQTSGTPKWIFDEVKVWNMCF